MYARGGPTSFWFVDTNLVETTLTALLFLTTNLPIKLFFFFKVKLLCKISNLLLLNIKSINYLRFRSHRL